MSEKRCRRCDVTKSVTEFYREKRNSDGLKSYCKPCCRELSRDHPNKKARQAKYYRENREKCLEWSRRWAIANPDRRAESTRRHRRNNPEAAKARTAQLYQQNKGLRDERSARWRIENAERYRELQREWGRNNRDRRRIWEQERRARQRGSGTISFSSDQLAQRWAYYGNRCWICRQEAAETDHVKPLARGGPHLLGNLRPICKSCNCRKSDRWPIPPWVFDGGRRVEIPQEMA